MAIDSVYEIMPSVTRRVMASHLMWEFSRILQKLCGGSDVNYQGLSQTSISHQIYVEIKCQSDLYSYDTESCSWQSLLELLAPPASIRPLEFLATCYRLMPENCEKVLSSVESKIASQGSGDRSLQGLEALSLVKGSVKSLASRENPMGGSKASGKSVLPALAIVAQEIEAAGLPYIFERKIEILDENE